MRRDRFKYPTTIFEETMHAVRRMWNGRLVRATYVPTELISSVHPCLIDTGRVVTKPPIKLFAYNLYTGTNKVIEYNEDDIYPNVV